METVPNKLHPLIAGAAVAVIALAGTGIAAFTGVLPGSKGSAKVAETILVQPAAIAPAVAVASPEPVPAPAAKPRPAVRKAVLRVADEPARSAYEPYYEPRAQARPAPRIEPLPQPVAQPVAPVCRDCGVIESVRAIESPGEGSGIGAVAGGVAGAVVGKQFGNGKGQTIATLLGAAGGAYAGHQVEKKVRTTKRYEIGVRMEDGTTRVLTLDSEPAWRAGDRVKVTNGVIGAA